MNDVRKMIYGAIIGLFVFVGLMISVVYISACGLTFTCNRADPKVARTPIPTLIPVSAAESRPTTEESMAEFNKCKANAADMIGAWVAAGTPEKDAFPFTDVDGRSCQGTYNRDIQPLFVENNLWHVGAIGCVSCHNADLTDRSKGLDLSSYNAVLLGSRRVQGSSSKGNELLGNGNWEKSVLYDVLVNQGLVPDGHSPDAPADTLILYAGETAPEATATPMP